MPSVAAKVLDSTKVSDVNFKADTIDLWSIYRDQAIAWKVISFLFIPGTICSILAALLIWNARIVNITVPKNPEPGLYQIKDISDVKLIKFASRFAKLVTTYEANIAKKQYKIALEMLRDPAYSKYKKELISDKFQDLENAINTQVYFIDPLKTKVVRDKRNAATVRLNGKLMKVISGRAMPNQILEFSVTLATVPRNSINPYGLVITEVANEFVR